MELQEKIQLYARLRQLRNPWHKDARLAFLAAAWPSDLAQTAFAAGLLQRLPQGLVFSPEAEVAWDVLPHRSVKGLTAAQQRLLISLFEHGSHTPPKPVYVSVLNRATAKSMQKRGTLQLVPCRHPESNDPVRALELTEAGWLVAGLLLDQCAWCGHEYEDTQDRQDHWADDCVHNHQAHQLAGQ